MKFSNRLSHIWPVVLSLLVSSTVIVGCGDSYLDKMWRSNVEHEEAVSSNAKRIAKLQAQCDTANKNIEAISALIHALSENDYVTGVSEINDGYRISLHKGGHVDIFDGHNGKYGLDGKDGEDGTSGNDGKNGQDGKDAHAPVISMAMSEGVWYWTLNGDFVTDKSGKKIPVNGDDSKSPQMRITNGRWTVSYDGGVTWTDAGNADGDNGDTIFSRIEANESDVVFFLSDGTSFSVPRYRGLGISLDIEGDEAGVEPRKEIQITYHLTNAGDSAVVTAASDGNYRVRINKLDDVTGLIIITSPKYYEDGHVTIIASDGTGYTIMKVISFYKREIRIRNLEYTIPPQGGSITIPIAVNFEYRLAFQDGDVPWLKYNVSTRAAIRNDNIELVAEINKEFSERVAVLELYAKNDPSQPLKQIKITQSPAVWKIERNRFMLNSNACSLSVSAVSTSGLTASCSEKWLSLTLESTDHVNYVVGIDVESNDSGKQRATEVIFHDEDGSKELGRMTVAQVAYGDENPDNMIFKVKAYSVNKYNAVLPLTGKVDCMVDWGDGSEHEKVTSAYPSHQYATVADEYIVRISGDVTGLKSEDKNASCVTEVIQWGKTGLTNMAEAFKRNELLTRLSPDKSGAFSEIRRFDYAFSECVSLESISEDLLVSATQMTSAKYMFQNCISLSAIPGNLLRNCKNLLNAEGVFCGSGILDIPEELFWNCPRIESVSRAFDMCRQIKTVPQKLLWKCPDITEVSRMFNDCKSLETFPEKFFLYTNKIESMNNFFSGDSALKALPKDLLSYCPELKSTGQAFLYCTSLKTVPVSLFDNNRKLQNPQEMFFGCGLSGESPYTIINGRKIHLYEREEEPDWFYSISRIYNRAFVGNHFTDQDSIPDNWKK